MEDAFYEILMFLEPIPHYFTLRRVSTNFQRMITHVVREMKSFDLTPIVKFKNSELKYVMHSLLELRCDNDNQFIPFEKSITISDIDVNSFLTLQRDRYRSLSAKQLTVVFNKRNNGHGVIQNLLKFSKSMDQFEIVVLFQFSYRLWNNLQDISKPCICITYDDDVIPSSYGGANHRLYNFCRMNLPKIGQVLEEYSLMNSNMLQLPILDKFTISDVKKHNQYVPILQANFSHHILANFKFLLASFQLDASVQSNFKKLYDGWFYSSKVLKVRREIIYFAQFVTLASTYLFVLQLAKELDEAIEFRKKVSIAKCKVECNWEILMNTEMKKNATLRRTLWQESRDAQEDDYFSKVV
jgi:hypothetical protein